MDFAAQWLNLRRLSEVVVDPDRYPTYDESLLQAFQRETELFVGEHAARRSQRRRAAERELHVRQRTAGAALRHPGSVRQPLPARDAAGPRSARRVARSRIGAGDDVLSGSHVAGLARQVAAEQHPRPPGRRRRPAWTRTWRRPSPAPCRRRFASGWRSTGTNPTCSSCHSVIDPLGFALEQFRRHRRVANHRRTGKPVDARGHDAERRDIEGLPACARCCSTARAVPRTVTDKLMSYALGRRLDYYDRPAVRTSCAMPRRRDYRWSSIIMGIVKSPRS